MYSRATCDSANNSLVIDIIQDNFFTQLVNEPTRECNILDLVLTTSPEFVRELAVGEPFSDHCCLTFFLFFSSVFTSEDCDNFPEFEYVTNSKLSNILCNTKEVEKLFKNLNIYKSPGPDSLPASHSEGMGECFVMTSVFFL